MTDILKLHHSHVQFREREREREREERRDGERIAQDLRRYMNKRGNVRIT
jgi:hypothetical protein